ncbi:hypothetical protein B0H19DRAFT_1262248 [Mycena capillaripes]|nr:hypothetical protein B0H19DRAFT_1262248 [Mycena capillaripes]
MVPRRQYHYQGTEYNIQVSRDILAAHSEIFRDMLTLPAPTSPDMMDGCPLVDLPDNAKDVEYFLRAIFYYDFFNPYPARTTFSIIWGVLQLSHKYGVEGLRKRALLHLSSGHPTTLADYKVRKQKRSWQSFTGRYCIPLIHLARQVSANWIIPFAVYDLCKRMDIEQVLGGTLINNSIVSLDRQDQIFVLQASTFFRCDAMSQMLDFLWCPTQIPECTRPTGAWKAVLDDICPTCTAVMKEMHQIALQSLWDRLPALCGLSGWEGLEKMKVEALK